MTLDDYRREFEIGAKRSLSMPIAGAIIWLFVALASTQFRPRASVLILLFSSGAIFPIALMIARWRGESIASTNPLAKLMGLCILMVNLLWAVHIIYAPEFVPLSLGIGLGLHWIVYSWIVGHPLGIVHAVLRTLLVALAWLSFPGERLLAVGLAITFAYAISIWQMSTRRIN